FDVLKPIPAAHSPSRLRGSFFMSANGRRGPCIYIYIHAVLGCGDRRYSLCRERFRIQYRSRDTIAIATPPGPTMMTGRCCKLSIALLTFPRRRRAVAAYAGPGQWRLTKLGYTPQTWPALCC